MKNETLKDKIKKVYWGAVGFTLIYFIIGAYLNSDGPKFDPKKTYELIKDALTLTATFLAPVAAFVLFSEWRVQHQAQKLELESENLIKKIYDSHLKLLELLNAVCSGDKYDKAINLKIFQLKNEIILQKKSICHDAERLKKLCKNELMIIIRSIEVANLILEGSEKLYSLQQNYINSDDTFIPNIDFMTPIFDKLNKKINEVNKIVLDLQI